MLWAYSTSRHALLRCIGVRRAWQACCCCAPRGVESWSATGGVPGPWCWHKGNAACRDTGAGARLAGKISCVAVKAGAVEFFHSELASWACRTPFCCDNAAGRAAVRYVGHLAKVADSTNPSAWIIMTRIPCVHSSPECVPVCILDRRQA